MTIYPAAVADIIVSIGQAALGFGILFAAHWVGRAIDAAQNATVDDATFMLISCEGAEPRGLPE